MFRRKLCFSLLALSLGQVRAQEAAQVISLSERNTFLAQDVVGSHDVDRVLGKVKPACGDLDELKHLRGVGVADVKVLKVVRNVGPGA